MKQFIYTFLVLLTVSCTQDFETINTNPNAPNEVSAEVLLRQVIYDFGEEMSYEGFVAGNLLAQHFTMVDFNLFDRHALTDPQLGGNPWPTIYRNLRDNEQLLNQSLNNEAERVYQAPALILKAYLAMVLTDIYGDAPFFEAFQGGAGIVTPKYDAQEAIYLSEGGVLSLLNEAIELLETQTYALPLNGDILLNGDLSLWLKFAHSLQLKALVRISAAQDVQGELSALLAKNNFIESVNEQAVFNFTAGRPNSFRMQQLRDGDFNLFVLSKTMADLLSDLEDPRVGVMFRPSSNDSLFAGLNNGPDASSTSISVADFALTGRIFREETDRLAANFLTAFEVAFLKAEANLILGNSAQADYENGVRLAFDYWQTPLPNNYFDADKAALNRNTKSPLEQIITQKWIANSINGYEGWIEYRRTGFPLFNAVSASLNNDLIPVKMPYPTDEAALNEENFVSATGGGNNDINAPVWWDR